MNKYTEEMTFVQHNINKAQSLSEIINIIHQYNWISQTKSGGLIALEDQGASLSYLKAQANKMVAFYAEKRQSVH